MKRTSTRLIAVGAVAGPVPTLQGEEVTVDLTDGVTLNGVTLNDQRRLISISTKS